MCNYQAEKQFVNPYNNLTFTKVGAHFGTLLFANLMNQYFIQTEHKHMLDVESETFYYFPKKCWLILNLIETTRLKSCDEGDEGLEK